MDWNGGEKNHFKPCAATARRWRLRLCGDDRKGKTIFKAELSGNFVPWLSGCLLDRGSCYSYDTFKVRNTPRWIAKDPVPYVQHLQHVHLIRLIFFKFLRSTNIIPHPRWNPHGQRCFPSCSFRPPVCPSVPRLMFWGGWHWRVSSESSEATCGKDIARCIPCPSPWLFGSRSQKHIVTIKVYQGCRGPS